MLLEDSEDEQNMQEFEKENQNRITLEVPEKVLRTKTIGWNSSAQKLNVIESEMAKSMIYAPNSASGSHRKREKSQA